MRSHSSSAQAATEEKETGRVEAFSDGVFAFAITLLALDVKLPQVGGAAESSTNASLFQGLVGRWPYYFAFATSFCSILIMWVHHHNVFRWVKRVDTRLLFTNGFLLMMVTVAPFPTAVFAEYFESPSATAACAFYAGYSVFMATAFSLMLSAAWRDSLRKPELPEVIAQRFCRSYRIGPLLYVLAFGSAFINKWLAMGICTALWIFWAFVARDAPRPSGSSDN